MQSLAYIEFLTFHVKIMAFTKETHHQWVLNFLKSKVREWGFHLDWLTKCCDRSMSQFLHQQVQSDDDFSQVVYAFSSFSNAIQTLKDAGSALFDEGLPWSDIDQLRHGKFIHLSRNAATHDGNPIISAWADGKFFVPNEIRRLNQKGQEVEILAPTVDARRFCLEFSQDFSDLLLSRLALLEDKPGPKFDIVELERGLKSHIVSEEARQIFKAQRAEIERAISSVTNKPAQDAIASLRVIQDYCAVRLEGVTP